MILGMPLNFPDFPWPYRRVTVVIICLEEHFGRTGDLMGSVPEMQIPNISHASGLITAFLLSKRGGFFERKFSAAVGVGTEWVDSICSKAPKRPKPESQCWNTHPYLYMLRWHFCCDVYWSFIMYEYESYSISLVLVWFASWWFPKEGKWSVWAFPLPHPRITD